MPTTAWFAAALLFFSTGLQAQTYPNQPIRLIVPWPPGGGVDTSARIIAQPLSERLGQSIVIDNRPGAGGNIGTEIAAKAKPDGYTLVMASSSPNAINIHIYPKLPFEPLKDFASIVYVTAVPNILVVPGASPLNSAQELLAHVKANPGKVNYGSAGVGSSQHLAASMLIAATGIDIVHVPYKGTGPAETDLIAGHIAMMLDTTACLPFVAGGRMKAFAVASKARNPALPNVPTFDETRHPGRLFIRLVRPDGAGRHAAGDRRSHQRGSEHGPEIARGAQENRRLRRRTRRRHAG